MHVVAAGLKELHARPGVNKQKLEMFLKEHNSKEAIKEAIPIFFVSKQYEEKKYKITWYDKAVSVTHPSTPGGRKFW